jgi:hypothetical protein
MLIDGVVPDFVQICEREISGFTASKDDFCKSDLFTRDSDYHGDEDVQQIDAFD